MYRRMNPKQLEKVIEDVKKWKMGKRTTTRPKIGGGGNMTVNASVPDVSLSTSTISMSDFEKAKNALMKANVPLTHIQLIQSP